MTLITCPKCRNQVSEQIQTCPKCGYSLPVALDNQRQLSSEWKRSIQFSFGIVVVFLAYCFWIYKAYGVWIPSSFFKTSTSTTSTSVQTQSSECTKASSYIWTNVRLYGDSSCTQPFATVYAGGQLQDGRKGVLLKFDNGTTEWKAREAVTSQSYVKTDDPAIKAMLFREMNQ